MNIQLVWLLKNNMKNEVYTYLIKQIINNFFNLHSQPACLYDRMYERGWREKSI